MNTQFIFSKSEKASLNSKWGVKAGFLRIKMLVVSQETVANLVAKLKILIDNKRIHSLSDTKKRHGMEMGELYQGVTYQVIEDKNKSSFWVDIHLKENSYGFNCLSTRDISFARHIDEEIRKMRSNGEEIS